MKHLFLIALSFVLLNLMTNARAAETKGTSMKVEGSCSGTLADGTAVSFTYYSDFDGSKNLSKSAITFVEGQEGLYTGSRAFKSGRDIYSFTQHSLSFADSTGNTSGKLRYPDLNNEYQTVEVQCDVRDYTYEV